MEFLEIIVVASFISALLLIFVFAFLVIRYALKNRSEGVSFPKKTIYLFGFLVLLAFAGGMYRTSVAKGEVAEFISQLDDTAVLFVNDKKIENPDKFFPMLSQFDYDFSSHNSFPQILINVRIVKKDKELKLELFRDSSIPNEYWVFYPKYGKIVKKEIAKVKTPLFDNIQP